MGVNEICPTCNVRPVRVRGECRTCAKWRKENNGAPRPIELEQKLQARWRSIAQTHCDACGAERNKHGFCRGLCNACYIRFCKYGTPRRAEQEMTRAQIDDLCDCGAQPVTVIRVQFYPPFGSINEIPVCQNCYEEELRMIRTCGRTPNMR